MCQNSHDLRTFPVRPQSSWTLSWSHFKVFCPAGQTSNAWSIHEPDSASGPDLVHGVEAVIPIQLHRMDWEELGAPIQLCRKRNHGLTPIQSCEGKRGMAQPQPDCTEAKGHDPASVWQCWGRANGSALTSCAEPYNLAVGNSGSGEQSATAPWLPYFLAHGEPDGLNAMIPWAGFCPRARGWTPLTKVLARVRNK